MGAVLLSLIANTALSLFSLRSGAYSLRLVAAMCACWTMQLVGTLGVFLLNDPMAGYCLIAMGAFGFVPIGVLGVRGAREVRSTAPDEVLAYF